MAKLFLLLGGNLGNKKQIFESARNRLSEELGKIIQHSSIYETEPWGFETQDLFWNQALIIDTCVKPMEVLRRTKKIEKELGRERKSERYASRTIDIDLLFYDQLVSHKPILELPHPRIIDRKFVLVPLAEIAPNWIHPVFLKTIMELLENCSDTLEVQMINDNE